jgi:hypothetical protein
MASSQETPARRDRNVRVSRGLRTGLVTAAVFSSLGLFGVVATDSAAHSAAPTPAAVSQPSPATAGQHVSIGPGSGGAPHAVTSGSALVSQPAASGSGSTSLLPGNGTVHAASHGS